MPQVKFSLEDVSRELAAFEKKLAIANSRSATRRDESPAGAPRELEFHVGKTLLYHYVGKAKKARTAPILIVYSLVNRPTVADLHPNASVVRDLLSRGLDVYIIEWSDPDRSDRHRGLDDYINRDLDACVNFILVSCKLPKVNLLGICQGGTFSVCYSALNPGKVANLITTITPIDFHSPTDLLSHMLRPIDAKALADAFGNIPGAWLNNIFLAQKPLQLSHQKYVSWLDKIDDPVASELFFAVERWLFDSPALAGAAFQEFVRDFYQANGLVRKSVVIGTRRIDLSAIQMPVLNIFASGDHLVPPPAARALGDLIGSEDYTELELLGGHIGIYINTKARARMVDVISEWLSARSEVRGLSSKRTKIRPGIKSSQKASGSHQPFGKRGGQSSEI